MLGGITDEIIFENGGIANPINTGFQLLNYVCLKYLYIQIISKYPCKTYLSRQFRKTIILI